MWAACLLGVALAASAAGLSPQGSAPARGGSPLRQVTEGLCSQQPPWLLFAMQLFGCGQRVGNQRGAAHVE